MRAGWTAALIEEHVARGITLFKFPEREKWHYRWRQLKIPLAVTSFLLVYGIVVYTATLYTADVTLPSP